jgi:2-methylcitrate dehydratase PrpD
MSIARDVAWQKRDKEIVHEAKRAILDSLGCAIGGHRAPARPTGTDYFTGNILLAQIQD